MQKMSAQDQRNDIIQEYIPELVRHLTGFEDDDINMEHCVHFGWNIIRNHRNLSTNSHDVRRRIEGIQERFRTENCPEYADYLGRMCDEVVKHPLCVDHYEVDVHWSLLDFLFTLAYNPTGALRKNKHKIVIQQSICEEVKEEDDQKEYWQNVLKEDFIPIPESFSSDSELSEWSDNNDSLSDTNKKTVAENFTLEEAKSITSFNQSLLGELKPPEKSIPFRKFNGTKAKEKLQDLIQHSWWKTKKDEHCNAIIESQHKDANFAINYNIFLSETSNNLIRFVVPTTITEEHVMRELLWMFHTAQKCSIFTINEENNQLILKENVTIPSCSVNCFESYIQENFLPFINMMQILRNFHKSIYSCEDRMPPRTLESYAANLNLHLSPIWEDILSYEKRLLNQQDFFINTLINMRLTLKDSFRHLESLFECHQQVILNWRQFPSHISAAFLLASLMHCYKVESNVKKSNLFISLLLASINVFCEIIDTWWTEGRLDDWQQEYIVERVSNVDRTVCMREYTKNKSKAFFVPTYVSNIIQENSLFHLMQEHSLEAGRTLNLLYEINRIGDLCHNCGAMQGKLYNVFIEDFIKQVKTLQTEVDNERGAINGMNEEISEDSGYYNEAATNTPQTNENSILNNLTTQDDFLLMAFALNTGQEDLATNTATTTEDWQETKEDKENGKINAKTIYDLLQKSKNYLPLEEVVINSLTRIFNIRIAFANCFVMRLYREEFMILKHLQYIRKVLLMEASDLMHQFYSKLFQQIESGENWANPSLLTMQLDDIICAKFPEMSSLFRLEINSVFRCRTTKVVEAVEEIIITYNLSRELAHIISPEDIQSYNKVFCFLLKVKWGITTLEKLQFARSHKRRIPYARFEMIDLIMRRLEQLRFWMMYAIQSVHFHLMTHVLQSMGEQLNIKIDNCVNLKEMEMVHKSYLSTVCEHCFLTESVCTIKTGVEQLLSLVSILRGEWLSCVKYIESNNPLAIDLDDSSDDYADTDFVTNSQIDAMEYTYICCHQYLANILNDQVYLQKRTFLSGLRAAFNTSLPH